MLLWKEELGPLSLYLFVFLFISVFSFLLAPFSLSLVWYVSYLRPHLCLLAPHEELFQWLLDATHSGLISASSLSFLRFVFFMPVVCSKSKTDMKLMFLLWDVDFSHSYATLFRSDAASFASLRPEPRPDSQMLRHEITWRLFMLFERVRQDLFVCVIEGVKCVPVWVCWRSVLCGGGVVRWHWWGPVTRSALYLGR